MPYAGLDAATLRRNAKDHFKAHPIDSGDDWHTSILLLWRDAAVREERYAALELLNVAKYQRRWLAPESLPLIEELAVTGAWWDYVDNLASNATGNLLRAYREEVSAQMHLWAEDQNLWKRRTAILCQLKFRNETDLDLLTAALLGSVDDPDFFARKAIGWALRELSKHNPDWVINFVQTHEARLSPLSKREGYKILLKNGRVACVPGLK